MSAPQAPHNAPAAALGFVAALAARDVGAVARPASSIAPIASLASHQRPSIGIDHPDQQQTATVIIVTTTPAETPTSTTVSGAVAATTTYASSSPMAGDNNDTGECRLLGPFAILVQLALGALALLSLVYKRWRERPQRPVKIWFFDASKQVVGSALVHVANVFMSMLTSGRFDIKAATTAAATGAGARRQAARALSAGLSVLVGARAVDDEYVPNPCSFYLLNLAIDVSIVIRFAMMTTPMMMVALDVP
jgi:hypothetical protein